MNTFNDSLIDRGQHQLAEFLNRQVESVEDENRGFDLISRRPHPADPQTFVEVRFIEVKGRAGVGVVALSENEHRTAERLKDDYWLTRRRRMPWKFIATPINRWSSGRMAK